MIKKPKTLGPGEYTVSDANAPPLRAVFKWFGYTIFLTGRTMGVLVRNQPLRGGPILTRLAIGVSWCSPAEKKVRYHDGWIDSYDRAYSTCTLNPHPSIQVYLAPGQDLVRAFKQMIRGTVPRDLVRWRVPNRLIEQAHGLPAWTLHTVIRPDGRAVLREYRLHERQVQGTTRARRASGGE